MADEVKSDGKEHGLIQSHTSLFPIEKGRWFPKHIVEGLHFSGEQNVQAFTVSASMRSEIYADADDPTKLVLVLKSDGITFGSDPMMRDQQDKKWLIKLRSGIAFEPMIGADEQQTINLIESFPESENKLTEINATSEFRVNASLNVNQDGGGGDAGASQMVSRNIKYTLKDFGYANTSQANRASWEWYLSKVGGDKEVRNTKDIGELVDDLLDGRTAVHALPNLAKNGTLEVQVIGRWRLDRAHWLGKKKIQFKVTASSWPLSINLPYTAQVVAEDIVHLGTQRLIDSQMEECLYLDEKNLEGNPITVDLSSLSA